MSPARAALAGLALALCAWGAAWALGSESVLDQLDELELKEAECANRIEALRTRERLLNSQLAATDSATAAIEQKLALQNAQLAARLRSFYKLSQVGRYEYLLGSRDLSDFERRRNDLERLVRLDHAQRTDYQDTLSQKRSAQAKVIAEREELRALLRELGVEKGQLDAKMAEKREFVAKLRADGKLLARATRELDRAKENLSQKVARLDPSPLREKDPQAGKRFAGQKGRLLCPVAARISRSYGEIKQEGAKSFHTGLDLDAPYGTPLRAPTYATVVFAGPFRGFGTLLILDHGGGYHTLYGHLSAISVAVGDEVKPGQIIAQTGDSGSLTGPDLYFELRVGGKPQNPQDWFTCR